MRVDQATWIEGFAGNTYTSTAKNCGACTFLENFRGSLTILNDFFAFLLQNKCSGNYEDISLNLFWHNEASDSFGITMRKLFFHMLDNLSKNE